jgi:5-hydroxyisourate hydrolase-like protein (transthyretin family)
VRVEVFPRHFDLVPGLAQPISVTISNTGDVIGGYTVRVLGADPSWVSLPDGEITLFPDETRTVVLDMAVPAGMNAGERRVAVQVREVTPPHESAVEEIVFSVPERPAVTLRVDPLATTAGRAARLSLLVANEGNTNLVGRPHGQDAEGKVAFTFTPPVVDLAPGEHAMVDLRAKARRPLMGSPVIRPLELRILDPAQAQAVDEAQAASAAKPEAAATPAEKLALKRRKKAPTLIGEDIPPMGLATFIQRPMLTRGPIALVGLLVALTVFAIVITSSLSAIVGQSAADRNLALQIAAARDAGASGTGSSEIGGKVNLLTSGKPVAGVSVGVFSADDTESALATTATDKNGAWKIGKLPAGEYKVTFRGAGFVQLWYPQAIDPADAEAVKLEPGGKQAALDVTLGGVPSSIAGKIVGDDVSASTITLKLPLVGATATNTAGTPLPPGSSGTTGSSGSQPISPTAAVAEQGATIKSVPVGDDGSFEITDVPSPNVYDLVVEKEGYATSTQRIDVSAGEERTGVEITLSQGDGVITGGITSGGAPLEDATVTASTGQTSVSTQTLTAESAGARGEVGSFTLRNLPTPATFTIVVSKDDYASETLTVTLSDSQSLGGIDLDLDKSSGSLAGQVSLETPTDDVGTSVAGVLVTVTNGTDTVQTATVPGDEAAGVQEGAWSVDGLPVPGEYTVTFSRDDLASQTVAVGLDGQGNLTTDALTGVINEGGLITVKMNRSTATIDGTVSQPPKKREPARPVGETVVQLISNTSTYTVTTATVPDELAGQYRFDAVPPGTYTLQTTRSGVAPVTKIITVAPGQDETYDLELGVAASILGVVENAGRGWIVDLYQSGQYPDGEPYRTTTILDDAGHFRIDDVDAPQTYLIAVRRASGGASLPLEGRDAFGFTVVGSKENPVRVKVSDD